VQNNQPVMKKSVSTIQGLSIVVGMIIGSGIFLKPGIVLKDAGNTTAALIAWIVGGVVTLASALSVAEISANITRSGGLYTYLEELYGKKWGFLLGWVQSIVSYPASVAALAIAFSTYAAYFIDMSDMAQRLLAIAVLALIMGCNILSTKFGANIQLISTIAKMIPIAAIMVLGFAKGSIPGSAGLSTELIGDGSSSIGVAILGTLWAYDGWISITNMTDEIKNPKKNLPKVIFAGIVFVILVYALFNIVLFNALPGDALAASATPGSDAAVAIFGESGAAIITAGIMISVFGALNGYLMTAARVPHVMASKGEIPLSGIIGKIHPKFGSPANALIMQSLLAVIYIFTGSFNTLTDLLVFVLWIFFTMGVFGVFILRKRGMSSKESYRVPLYPITPIIGIAGSIFILVSTVISTPLRALIGIAITAVGIPVYMLMNRKK